MIHIDGAVYIETVSVWVSAYVCVPALLTKTESSQYKMRDVEIYSYINKKKGKIKTIIHKIVNGSYSIMYCIYK